jgi:hypothetical protein
MYLQMTMKMTCTASRRALAHLTESEDVVAARHHENAPADRAIVSPLLAPATKASMRPQKRAVVASPPPPHPGPPRLHQQQQQQEEECQKVVFKRLKILNINSYNFLFVF